MVTPVRSSLRFVKPEWIDFNGHLNMAYDSVLMDNAVDDAYGQVGFGPEYQKQGCTTYVAEFPMHDADGAHVAAGKVTVKLLSHGWKK